LPEGFAPAKSGAVQGKTLAEKWILHKMNSAARDINKALADREFSKSTLIVYRYWYNELCDVYIENSKAIIREGTPEERESAIQTLYTTLETALTMIHPFMPFITEEMWQRMPRRPGDETKSIMIAKYPTYTEVLDDPESEAAYELVLGCSKAARSLMAEYALKDQGESKRTPLKTKSTLKLELHTDKSPQSLFKATPRRHTRRARSRSHPSSP
jgi:valyl-tRNA synthetase